MPFYESSRVDGRTDLFPKLYYGLSENTKKPTNPLATSSQDIEEATGSTQIALILDDSPNCPVCNGIPKDPLSKVRDGDRERKSNTGKECRPEEYSYGDDEIEEELAYSFFYNCKNTKRAGEGKLKG